jgi:NEDD8-activating enzyme E1
MCTIRNVPRLPEHCIQYALKVQWPLLETFQSADHYTMRSRADENSDANDDEAVQHGSVSLDKDNIHHMTWIYNRASERASKYNIDGVTFNLTMQVVKNIIPAIASTNALIAAACVNEAFKYRTMASKTLNNYYMYIGASATQGIHTETLQYERNPQCSVCHQPLIISINPMSTLQQLIDMICQEASLDSPSLIYKAHTLYMPNLHSLYADNLSTTLISLHIEKGSRLTTTDKNGRTLKVIVHFTA